MVMRGNMKQHSQTCVFSPTTCSWCSHTVPKHEIEVMHTCTSNTAAYPRSHYVLHCIVCCLCAMLHDITWQQSPYGHMCTTPHFYYRNIWRRTVQRLWCIAPMAVGRNCYVEKWLTCPVLHILCCLNSFEHLFMQLLNHLQIECPYHERPCAYRAVGCTMKVSYSIAIDLLIHASIALADHRQNFDKVSIIKDISHFRGISRLWLPTKQVGLLCTWHLWRELWISVRQS